MLRCFSISLLLGLAGTGPALADCSAGADLRTSAKAELSLFMQDPSSDQAWDSRQRARAYSVLVWDSYGRDQITGDYDISILVGGCYEKGDCGLSKDAELGSALRRLHVKRYNSGQTPPQPASMPVRPPHTAVAWARDYLGGSCATSSTQLASTNSKDVVSTPEPVAPSAVVRRETVVTPEQRMETLLNGLIAEMISQGQVSKLLEPPYDSVVTMEQAAQALTNRMNYFQTPPRSSTTYGVDSTLPTYFLERIIPYMPETHREQIRKTLPYIRSLEASRARQYAYQDAVSQTKAGLAKAYEDLMARSGGAQGGRSIIEQRNWEDYIRGRASREPCSIAKPCGPDSQFNRTK